MGISSREFVQVRVDNWLKIGVCYYPEQWARPLWREDARRMVDLGIDRVRIGEFAWSLMEPDPGNYDWEWLDDIINILGEAGLKVILGTPTATPPKWLVDQYPDILSTDQNGDLRKFGSRRHYCFSSKIYLRESQRIVTAMAERYRKNQYICGWQTDNEYGCHNTVRSYSQNATFAFRSWLEDRYHTIDDLNQAWGAVFWSQIYREFNEIDLPNLTVTEANPSHQLDFYRFSSDQVVAYNRAQVDILRYCAPNTDIYHNFMGHFTDFDHFALGRDIDIASWDSYPLGFLDQEDYAREDKIAYLRQGHPDFAAFHHDLYRACGGGRFAVMEQQPGSVNWAPNNPAPLSGMVRLWGHEVAAHGGEMVSFFRWRQAPFAQENLHAGLLRHDNEPAQAWKEVETLAHELKTLHDGCNESDQYADHHKKSVALIFSYETMWMSEIKPQGTGWDYFHLVLEWYGAARALGCNIDIIEPGDDLSSYDLVLVPSLFHVSKKALSALKNTKAQILFGPRSGSMTGQMHLSENLAPGPLQDLIELKVAYSESLPDDHYETGKFRGETITGKVWLDHIETDLTPLASLAAPAGSSKNNTGLLYRDGAVWMLTCVPDTDFLTLLMRVLFEAADIKVKPLPMGMRCRENDLGLWVFNYAEDEQTIPAMGKVSDGKSTIAGAGVALLRDKKSLL